MNSKVYKWCAVPQCKNTSIKTPNKVFVYVPNKKILRDKWLKLARRNPNDVVTNSPIYFCEDHFDLPNDMENYMEYHVMGSVSQVRMKPGCMPKKFNCQPDRKTQTSDTTERPYIAKKRKMMIQKECDKQLEGKSIVRDQSSSEEIASGSSGVVNMRKTLKKSAVPSIFTDASMMQPKDPMSQEDLKDSQENVKDSQENVFITSDSVKGPTSSADFIKAFYIRKTNIKTKDCLTLPSQMDFQMENAEQTSDPLEVAQPQITDLNTVELNPCENPSDLPISQKENLCRCCLSSRGTYDFAQSYISDTGEDLLYLDMLKNCLGIHLSMINTKNRNICNECADSLIKAHAFKLQVMRAEQKFNGFCLEIPSFNLEDFENKPKPRGRRRRKKASTNLEGFENKPQPLGRRQSKNDLQCMRKTIENITEEHAYTKPLTYMKPAPTPKTLHKPPSKVAKKITQQKRAQTKATTKRGKRKPAKKINAKTISKIVKRKDINEEIDDRNRRMSARIAKNILKEFKNITEELPGEANMDFSSEIKEEKDFKDFATELVNEIERDVVIKEEFDIHIDIKDEFQTYRTDQDNEFDDQFII